MKTIQTETVIPIGEHKTIYSSCRCYIRVEDEAGGPYLSIEGIDDEAEEGKSQHVFYLQSIKEIDEFAAICKRILKNAEEVSGE